MNNNDLMEKLHKILLVENSYSISETEANKYFDEFNTKYFNNKLEKIPVIITIPEENDKLNLNDIGKTIASIYYTHRSIITKEILLNKNKIYSFEEFRDALVHEMIHYYVNVYFPPKENQWNMVLKTYTLDELKITKNSIDTFNILGLNDNKNHKGQWKYMADKLNKDFPELKIIENKHHINQQFVDNYIKSHTIYFINDKLIVLNNGSDYYNRVQNSLKRGTNKLNFFCGSWYEIVFNGDLYNFDYIMNFNNFLEENIYNIDPNFVKRCEANGYFKKKFIKTIKLDLTESNTKYKNWEDVPIELLKELDVIWKDIPIS